MPVVDAVVLYEVIIVNAGFIELNCSSMASSSGPLLNEAVCPDQENAVDVSLSKNDRCLLEGGNDERQDCGEHDEDEDEDEDEDFDFNPFLRETLSIEASSSLSSEIEGVEIDVVDSGVGNSPLSVTALLSKPASQVKDYSIGDGSNGREVSVQASVASDDANKAERAGVFQDNKSILVSGLEIDSVTEKGGGSKNGKVVNNVVVGDFDTGLQSTGVIMDVDNEDAICRRTRARYSLASFTLDELETFLQETDDEDDLPNVDDEAEYRKFLAAVLHGGDADHVADKENENIEDEDEDNDADFELEIEEALESDVDEILKSTAQVQSSEGGGRRPETRQNKRQKSSAQLKKRSSEHLNMPLRPLLPNVPILPSTAIQGNLMLLDSAPCRQLSSAYESMLNGFTPHQIGQLHCLIHEHVQLLIQVYSLCIFEPSKGNIATQIQQLILEILKNRNQVLTWRTAPYPSSYFFPPYIRPSVSNDCKISLPTQNTVSSSMNALERDSCPENNITLPSDSGQHKSVSCSKEGQLQGTEGPMWMPYINGHVLSILDVAPLNLVKSYMDEVSSGMQF